MELFGEIPKVKVAKKGRANSACAAVFHDYESFLAKFQDKEKTTDDCYTPKDVYEAVVRYVGTVVDLTDKVILRPFYPGGDLEIVTAPTLDEAIRNCESQKNNAPLPKRAYPDNLVTVSDLQTIARGGVYYELRREEAAKTDKIGKIDLFGGALITSTRKGEEKAQAKAEARAKIDNRQHIEFSDNEKRIVEMLDGLC